MSAEFPTKAHVQAPAQAHIQLSVVTVAFNRPVELAKKLSALQQQSLERALFEWIVCINGKNEAIEAVLAQADTALNLKVLRFEENQGVARARNACIRQAQGLITYFSDDDCLPDPDTLNAHIKAQQRHSAVYIGTIRFESPKETECWRPKKVHYWNLNGANSSAPTQLLLSLGGFDERLRHYGGEDILLGYRLKQSGLPFYVLTGAETIHLGPNPMSAYDLHKAFSAGQNAHRISRYEPKLAWRLGVHPLLLPIKKLCLQGPKRVQAFSKRLLGTAHFHYEQAYLRGVQHISHAQEKEEP